MESKSIQKIQTDLQQLAARSNQSHLLLQFRSLPNEALRNHLKSDGLEILTPLGKQVYFASLRQNANINRLAQVGQLKDAKAIDRNWKLHPSLLLGKTPLHALVSEDTIAVYVIFHADVKAADQIALIQANLAGKVVSKLDLVSGLVLELPRAFVDALAEQDEVQWVEPALPRFSIFNNLSNVLSGASAVHQAPYHLSGAGINVLLYDGGAARSTHVDFGGRLFARDASALSDHATHVG